LELQHNAKAKRCVLCCCCCCCLLQVFAHSTPILSHYRPEARAKAILPDLAALVWSACQVGVGVCVWGGVSKAGWQL
jgi:hypothetical protein